MNSFEFVKLAPVSILDAQRQSTYDPLSSIIGAFAAWEVTT